MCGIAGSINFNGERPCTRPEIEAMCDAIRHRGPDSDGYYLTAPSSGKPSVGIGIRRLAINDLVTGNQPISNETKTLHLVCNGEIYNYPQLRKELEAAGHRFTTSNDVEAIVHLYEDHGIAALQKLRGMFAFALWDSRAGKLVIARDRIGKKPLIYAVWNGTLVFGSEFQAVLTHPLARRVVSREAIDSFLTFQYIPSPLSAFEGINKLQPGHYLVCGTTGIEKNERYWQPSFLPKIEMSEPEWEKAVTDKLREATRIRLMSDVPLGAFLSGGIDSSAVVAMMAQESSRPVKTFTIGFSQQEYSELGYGRAVARHLGTDHHELIVEPHAVEVLPILARHYGEPFGDSSALPSYYVAQITRRNVTVALNGDGGDESFAGYLRYRAMKLSRYLAPLGLPLKLTVPAVQALMRASSGKQRIFWHRIQRGLSAVGERGAVRNVRWHCIFDNERKNSLYTPEMTATGTDRTHYLSDLYDAAPCDNMIDRLLYTDQMSYLPECLLVKMDIASMANSLEARSPFLDHELIELAGRMPASYKMRGLTGKHILKKALAPYLPHDILYRQKMGFGIPVHHWFRKELKDFLEGTILSARAINRGYFKPDALRALFAEHQAGFADHGYRLWALLMLELWHREFIDTK